MSMVHAQKHAFVCHREPFCSQGLGRPFPSIPILRGHHNMDVALVLAVQIVTPCVVLWLLICLCVSWCALCRSCGAVSLSVVFSDVGLWVQHLLQCRCCLGCYVFTCGAVCNRMAKHLPLCFQALFLERLAFFCPYVTFSLSRIHQNGPIFLELPSPLTTRLIDLDSFVKNTTTYLTTTLCCVQDTVSKVEYLVEHENQHNIFGCCY